MRKILDWEDQFDSQQEMSTFFSRFALLLCKRFLNLIIILCFITPAVVIYWRGTWYILDLFVFPDDKVLSALLTFTASFGAIFLILFVEDYLKAFLDSRKAKKGLYLLLFYPLAFLIVTSWRGMWMMLDLYTTTAITSAIVSHVVGVLILLCTKTSSSIVSIPGYCSSERLIDLSQSILKGKKYFRITTSACADITTRMLNSFFTVFIIGGAVICYWRGTWLIIVTAMIPPTPNVKSWVALNGLGYAVVTMCYCLSEFFIIIKLTPPYSLMSRSLEQVFVYILGFGVVASWVGMWHLMDIYLLPGKCCCLKQFLEVFRRLENPCRLI